MKDNTKTDNEPLTPTEQDSEIQKVEAEIDKLSPRQRNLVIERYEESSQIYEGPLPPASELIKYNEAHPDAADRIIAMAEKEQEARLVNATYMLREDAKTKKRGQFMGFIIALIVLGGGCSSYRRGALLKALQLLSARRRRWYLFLLAGDTKDPIRMEISNRESIDFRLFFFLKEYTSEPCQGAIIVSSRNVKRAPEKPSAIRCVNMRVDACRCVIKSGVC